MISDWKMAVGAWLSLMECRGLAADDVSGENKTTTGRKSGGAVKFDEASSGCPYRLEPSHWEVIVCHGVVLKRVVNEVVLFFFFFYKYIFYTFIKVNRRGWIYEKDDTKSTEPRRRGRYFMKNGSIQTWNAIYSMKIFQNAPPFPPLKYLQSRFDSLYLIISG